MTFFQSVSLRFQKWTVPKIAKITRNVTSVAMASLSRVQRYCLVLVLFIWSVSLDTIPVEGLQTPIFTAELPKAACAGVATSHIGKGAKYVVNGTMVSVHPEVSPGVYEQEAKLVVLVQNFTENIRGPVGASVCNTNLRKVTDLDLNDCDCAESPYLTQVGDWSESGVLFSFSNCSAQPNVSILVSFGVPDKDYSEVFDTMVPGSTADNFTYFHPYVIVLQPNKNSFSGSVDPDRQYFSAGEWPLNGIPTAAPRNHMHRFSAHLFASECACF